MKEKLKQRFLNYVDLPQFEKKYILEVVKYIDSYMEMLSDDNIKFDISSFDNMGDGIFKIMMDLVISINNCTTGVRNIDNIIELRKQNAYNQIGHLGQRAIDLIESTDYSTFLYDDSINIFIAALSNYGGIYMLACNWYKNELEHNSKGKLKYKFKNNKV